jgi:hypothetical protein
MKKWSVLKKPPKANKPFLILQSQFEAKSKLMIRIAYDYSDYVVVLPLIFESF